MTGSLAVARQVVSRVHLALQESGHEITATLDPAEAVGTLGGGSAVAIVAVEQTTFQTWTVADHAVTVTVCSPTPDALDAWEQLEPIGEALREPLEVETARLTMWQGLEGNPWPALHLTTTVTTN